MQRRRFVFPFSAIRARAYGWKIPHGKPMHIHLLATIREASRNQKNRIKSSERSLKIFFEDIREKLRLYKVPITMVFVIDLRGAVKEAGRLQIRC